MNFVTLLISILLLSGCSIFNDLRRDTLLKASQNWELNNHQGLSYLKTSDLTKAQAKFQLALNEAKNCGVNDLRIAITLNNIAGVYELQHNYPAAIDVLEKASNIAKANQNTTVWLNSQYNLARLLALDGQNKLSLILYKEVFSELKSRNKAYGLNINKVYTEYLDLLEKNKNQ